MKQVNPLDPPNHDDSKITNKIELEPSILGDDYEDVNAYVSPWRHFHEEGYHDDLLRNTSIKAKILESAWHDHHKEFIKWLRIVERVFDLLEIL